MSDAARVGKDRSTGAVARQRAAVPLAPEEARTMARAGRRGSAGGSDAMRLAMLVLAAGAGVWVGTRLVGTGNGRAIDLGRELDGKRRPDMPTLSGGRGFRVERTMTINRTPDELYRVWRNFEHLRELMPHLQSVTELD